MSDPTPNVGKMTPDPLMLDWQTSVFHLDWGFDDHSVSADVGYLPHMAPDPRWPWEADCLGPGANRMQDWYATEQDAMDAVESHIAGYIDATWPDPDFAEEN